MQIGTYKNIIEWISVIILKYHVFRKVEFETSQIA